MKRSLKTFGGGHARRACRQICVRGGPTTTSDEGRGRGVLGGSGSDGSLDKHARALNGSASGTPRQTPDGFGETDGGGGGDDGRPRRRRRRRLLRGGTARGRRRVEPPKTGTGQRWRKQIRRTGIIHNS